MVKNTSSENLIARPVPVNALITYQKRAVVSTTLFDEDDGTITLFGFDRGQGLSEHKSPFNALVLALEGSARISILGEDFKLEPGQMMMIPANKPHAFRALEQFKMLLIMIRTRKRNG